jgi:hypothetical protein
MTGITIWVRRVRVFLVEPARSRGGGVKFGAGEAAAITPPPVPPLLIYLEPRGKSRGKPLKCTC